MDYLDKMERERAAMYAAPKPEPIHVILDSSNVCDTTSVSSSFGIPVENGGYTPV
jgi:hypothetical protein